MIYGTRSWRATTRCLASEAPAYIFCEELINACMSCCTCYDGLPVFFEKSRLETGWFWKPRKMNIIVHQLSTHPTAVKANVLRGMEVAAVRTCSNEDKRKLSVQKAEALASYKGHDGLRFCSPVSFGTKHLRESAIFKTPFVSESFSATVFCLIGFIRLLISIFASEPELLRIF